MHVVAAPGHRVPIEGEPDKYIDPDAPEPSVVPDSSYYRRRIADGELLPATPASGGAKSDAKPKETKR